jgi:hypothetical protein
MTQNIENLIGKKGFLSNSYILSNKIDYESGIKIFDEQLNGKSVKDLNSVIQIEIFPKGLLLKIAKNFS